MTRYSCDWDVVWRNGTQRQRREFWRRLWHRISPPGTDTPMRISQCRFQEYQKKTTKTRKTDSDWSCSSVASIRPCVAKRVAPECRSVNQSSGSGLLLFDTHRVTAASVPHWGRLIHRSAANYPQPRSLLAIGSSSIRFPIHSHSSGNM